MEVKMTYIPKYHAFFGDLALPIFGEVTMDVAFFPPAYPPSRFEENRVKLEFKIGDYVHCFEMMQSDLDIIPYFDIENASLDTK